MSNQFGDIPPDHIQTLIDQVPLCWIVPHAQPDAALLMPVILERDPDGALVSLLGHLPKSRPALKILQENGAATFLFLGPNAYIAPSVAGKTDWAPTWNFASAILSGDIKASDDLTRAAITKLVSHMEGPAGWDISRLGERFDQLAEQIIGFRATISSAVPRFKLAQDENADVRQSIISALSGTPLGIWTEAYEKE